MKVKKMLENLRLNSTIMLRKVSVRQNKGFPYKNHIITTSTPFFEIYSCWTSIFDYFELQMQTYMIFLIAIVKGTLMQIWKLLYMFMFIW